MCDTDAKRRRNNLMNELVFSNESFPWAELSKIQDKLPTLPIPPANKT